MTPPLQATTRDPAGYAIVAAVLTGLAIQLRRGRFDEVALAAAVVAGLLVAASLAVATGEGRPVGAPIRWLGRVALVVQLGAFVPVFREHLLDEIVGVGATLLWLVLAVVVVVALDQLADRPTLGTWGRGLLVVGVGILGVAWVVTNETGIDVLSFQEVAVDRLLAGVNPYAFGYPNPYSEAQTAMFYGPGLSVDGLLQFGFPYPPLSLLLVVPGEWLGDVRYTHLAAMLATGWLLMTMVRGSWASRAAGVLFLTTPMLLRVVEWAFTEAFLALGLVATLWLLRRGRGVAGVVMLGLFFAVKQYAVLFLPLVLFAGPAFRTARERWRVTWQSVAVAAAVTVPWALVSLREFVFSVAELQLQQPFRPDSLSVLAFSVNTWDWPPSSLHLVVILVATGVAMWWALAQAPRTWQGMAAGIATVHMAFLLFNKQAFTNYYLFAIAVLCLALALRDAPDHAETSHPVTAAQTSRRVTPM